MCQNQNLLENMKNDHFSNLTGLKLPKFGPNAFLPKTYSTKKTWTKKMCHCSHFSRFQGHFKVIPGAKNGRNWKIATCQFFKYFRIQMHSEPYFFRMYTIFRDVSHGIGHYGPNLKKLPFFGSKRPKMCPKTPIFTKNGLF